MIEVIRELHDSAMHHLERAEVSKFAAVPAVRRAINEHDGKISDANTELKIALDFELRAAKLAEELGDGETQSLLTKSAAAIAFRLGRYQQALDLAKSLLPYAPALIVSETERMIETIEHARDQHFITSAKPEPVSRPKGSNSLNQHLPVAIGIAICVLVGSIVNGGGQHNDLLYLVGVLAAALIVLTNIVR